MIDILYIIATNPSKNFDVELKCSLRTVHKYVKDVGRIYITGRCPDFINKDKVIFTPARDIGCPMINHWWKIKQTIARTDIGENFALMYDDIFFKKPVTLSEYKHYQQGKLMDNTYGGPAYRESIENTIKWLEERKFNTYDYELHIPFVYNRENFLSLEPIFSELKKDEHAMAVRSVYANMFNLETPYKHDVKIRKAFDTIDKQVMKQECLSTTDNTFPIMAAPFIEPHIQERSQWEK